MLHILNQCLRAHSLYKRDVNYLVADDGKVLIIDEFTGRVLPGRRWSDGLHQAVEAKENVRIQEETRTMATITFQNLFRLYKKLSGMTGTAETEATEFHETYKLGVVATPTNKPMIREDHQDVVYKTEREKFTAVVPSSSSATRRASRSSSGRRASRRATPSRSSSRRRRSRTRSSTPSTTSARRSSSRRPGAKGAITVSTNMAGRGTDIVLGGNAGDDREARVPRAGARPGQGARGVRRGRREARQRPARPRAKKCASSGGLHILGTERHESRRIDNQLRGRAGRQGDPGSSRFYLSLEDDLMRIFAGDRVKSLMERMGMPDNEPIVHPWVTKSIQDAQRKVEERNFDIRKHLLEYDDVMNEQRKTVYKLRQQLLLGIYKPEKLDEDGKPTGKMRDIKTTRASPRR